MTLSRAHMYKKSDKVGVHAENNHGSHGDAIWSPLEFLGRAGGAVTQFFRLPSEEGEVLSPGLLWVDLTLRGARYPWLRADGHRICRQ